MKIERLWQGKAVTIVGTVELDTLEARIEALERRERVGDRMHDFLCRLFSNPRLLPESFAPEAWTLMQDWTAPPPEAALRSEEET